MSDPSPSPFSSNWAYLKTELSWLERLLMLAIARQRKELKDLGKVARNKADRVSSHWWRGLITVPQKSYDEGPPPSKKSTTAQSLSYQQQIDIRVQATHAKGLCLALPHLKKALNLNLFEKNLVLMALAPEVNVRFGRLYCYLQTGQENTLGELPTVDLVLRLLCRNELERRQARAQLTGAKSLIQKQVIQVVTPPSRTFLGSYLQLTDEWVNYLLSDAPKPTLLMDGGLGPTLLADASADDGRGANSESQTVAEGLTATVQAPLPKGLVPIERDVDWAQVVLPDSVITQLQTLTQQVQVRLDSSSPKSALFLVGETGTGKTTAAVAISTALQQPIYHLDLGQVTQDDWPSLLDHLQHHDYPVVLVTDAHHWFGRHGGSHDSALQAWFSQSSSGLIILSARYRHVVRSTWRQQMDVIVELPCPDADQREALWKLAFGKKVKGLRKTDWTSLARGLKLTGGQIFKIAELAITLAMADELPKAEMKHLQRALAQCGQSWERKSSTRKTTGK